MPHDHLPGFSSATLFTAATRRIEGGATAFHLDGDRFGVMHDLVELSISEGALEAPAGVRARGTRALPQLLCRTPRASDRSPRGTATCDRSELFALC